MRCLVILNTNNTCGIPTGIMWVHCIFVSMRSAAGGGGGDGGVDVKMLAEQNVKLKEALKRLHTHSIAEKTDVSTFGFLAMIYENVQVFYVYSYVLCTAQVNSDELALD